MPTRPSYTPGVRTRVLALLLPIAAVTGFGLEIVKGNSGDALRDALGNMSTPWLVIPLVAGFLGASVLRGAALGLLATTVALTGFYVGATLAFGNHLGDATGSFAHNVRFIADANKVWFILGAVSGPILGAIGGYLRRPLHVAGAAGAMLVLEPIVVRAVQGRHLPLIGAWSVDSVAAQSIEVGLGLVVLAVAMRPRSERPRSSS